MSSRLHGSQKAHELVLEADLFTFWRAGAVVALLSALPLASCAPTTARAPAPDVGAVAPAGPSYATIAAVRPIAPTVAAGDSRAQILTAMGVPVQSGAAMSEFVLQTDDGRTLSIVTADGLHFVPGQRVRLVPGPVPSLAPALSAAPAS